jgi:hypothetical protein
MATEKATGTELATTEHVLPELRSSRNREANLELRRILLGEQDAPPPEFVDETDPDEMSRQILAQILASETVQDVFSVVGEAHGWREYADVPVELHGFRWRPSDKYEASKFFLIVFATDLTNGESLALTTGSMNIIAQLVALADQDSLEGTKVKLVIPEKTTKAGFRPLHLQMLGTVEASELVEFTELPDDQDQS